MPKHKSVSEQAVREARLCLLASSVIKNSPDPADALLVLLSGPLSLLHGEVFEPQRFCQKIKEQFGWEFPPSAVDFLVPKLRQLGWLASSSAFPSRGPFLVDLPEPSSESDSSLDTQRALSELGQAFAEFASHISPISALPADPLEAGVVLLRQVVDTPAASGASKPSGANDAEYLSARFIDHVTKKKLPIRETLSQLSAVGFLFRVAEEIGSPTPTRRTNLRVAIDSPIILDLLQCSGPIRAQAASDLISDLKKIGAQIVTFEHCVDEAREALGSVLRAQPVDRYGPTGEALRRGWVHENALIALSGGFDSAVRSNGIDILHDTHEYMPNSHQYFDRSKIKSVESIINWHDPENETARYRDADTVIYTMRRRGGHKTGDLFDSRYVAVTSNDAFAGSVRRHLEDLFYYNNRHVPPVVSMKELAAKLWLEVGNKDREDRFRIPRSQMLLSCDRALRYNRRVVERAKEELAKISEEQLKQFELLLQVPRSARAIADAALNNDRYVSGDTVGLLLEAAVEAAGEEVGAKERKKREKDKAEFEAKLAQAESAINEVNVELHSVKSAVSSLQQNEEAMLDAICVGISARFYRAKVAIRLLSFAVALGALFQAIPFSTPWEISFENMALALLTAILAAAVAMDRPGAWLTKTIHRFLANSAERQLHRIGRTDLGNRLSISWQDGKASWALANAA